MAWTEHLFTQLVPFVTHKKLTAVCKGNIFLYSIWMQIYKSKLTQYSVFEISNNTCMLYVEKLFKYHN